MDRAVCKGGGLLACEVGGFDFEHVYGDRGRDYIECHHCTPLHISGATTIRLDDLVLIRSNCHRMIHRTADWLLPEQLRDIVEGTPVTVRRGGHRDPVSRDLGSGSRPALRRCHHWTSSPPTARKRPGGHQTKVRRPLVRSLQTSRS